MSIFANLIFAWFFVFRIGGASADTLTEAEQRMASDSDLSEFYSLLQRSPLAKVALKYKQVTIFAPINSAFQTYTTEIDDPNEIIPYHIANVPKKTGQLGTSYTSLFSELTGSPILWVTHTTGTYHDDIYINNAKMLISQSNIQVNQNSNEQVIHKIDEVLIPTRSVKNAANKVFNPTAWEFLESYESLIMGDHRVRSYRQRVQATNKEDIFKTEGGHTFFIPVDEGFKGGRAAAIDGKVIDGHVIPKQVLFTAPTKKGVPFQTLANGDNNLRVTISFTQEERDKRVIHYVKSHTILGDGKHTQGIVLAEIVKANIPVKNGVVHLIQRPLMIVDNSVKELLLEQMDYICNVGIKKEEQLLFEDIPPPNEHQWGLLSSFVNAINETAFGQEFFDRLNHDGQITLFAPCSTAWINDLTLKKLMRDPARFREILNLHLVVDDKIYVDKILKNAQGRSFQSPTLNKQQNLYFNVNTVGNNRTVTVEGGGVNATVLQADLAATNGIIHVIDRVLGIPYSNILDKLEKDPQLNITYQLGLRRGFNNYLNDTNKRYTFFVPRDFAWKEASIKFPSTTKVLLMPDYAYHSNNILERHLVATDDEVYTMERIKQLSDNSSQQNKFRKDIELRTIRGGSLRLYVEEKYVGQATELDSRNGKPADPTFTIHWNGERIPVYRPDIECTNGIIHIIDMPLLQESDVHISGASMLWITSHLLLLTLTTCLI
ncbi:fasciclin-1 isoform X2 [Coccinella septempunctata]|uniref:fasciclin-1 isoform X2 n=1 Tax=Coccinella septempunctata TaxID=41139 RepID=UPI001D0743A8|nr:fasciclin-1 isoform X2 [Coccinella septempunctata]